MLAPVIISLHHFKYVNNICNNKTIILCFYQPQLYGLAFVVFCAFCV